MNAESGARDLLLELELRRGRLRQSLRAALRGAIQDGRLVAGTRLPSSRRLAADLQVSRGVVTDTYDQLTGEGYLQTAPRAAPVVASVGGVAPAATEPAPPTWRYDFAATTPDVSLFPRHSWVRATQRALAAAPDRALDYSDHRGRIELRTALASYLARVRGVRVDPGRILITQGFTQGLDLLCRVLAGRGAGTIAVESPSLPDLWDTVRGHGLALRGCPVDDQGVLPPDQPVDALVLSPAHQFPTGVVLRPSRRAALLAGVAGLLIEDDYDAEFRYDRSPVGALQGLDPARVVHLGTASKTLAPGVRLGWASLPADLVEEARAAKAAADSGSPVIDQLALAELLESGDYERHVARARQVYRRRRDRLVAALRGRRPDLAVTGAAAGMHLLLPLPGDDLAIAADAAGLGINVRPLSPMYLTEPVSHGLLLGYGRLREDSIEPAVDLLLRTLRS